MTSIACSRCFNIAKCPNVSHWQSKAVHEFSSIKDHQNKYNFFGVATLSVHRNLTPVVKANGGGGGGGALPGDDGVSLGTMKLPFDTDLARFETLLFQWANSLSQGASVPLPMPLKVDKIPGGARLGFTEVGNENTDVSVYIDCLVFPGVDNAIPPMFRATRNGPSKDQSPPGESKIMRSLLAALQKCVEIARL